MIKIKIVTPIFLTILLLLMSVVFIHAKEPLLTLKPFPLQDGSMRSFDGRPKDKDGIVMIDYGHPRGVQYSPVGICQFAHKCYIKYYNREGGQWKELFLKHADWLVSHQKIREDFGVWEYHFDNNFGAKAPWISGMAQGLGISVLSEAYVLTGKEKYLDCARRVLGSFEREVNHGGVVSKWGNGDIWYEEIATTRGKKTLNGFIFSLAGLCDYFQLTGDPRARRIIEKGFISLRNHISEYDLGFGSRYSLLEGNVKWGYHKIHCIQLVWAYLVTEDEKFLEYARRFLSYDPIKFDISVSCTKDLALHGPSRLNDHRMFWSYWSCDSFPVEIELIFGQKQNVEGLVFFSLSEKTAARTYLFEIVGEGGSIVKAVKDNKSEDTLIKDSVVNTRSKGKKRKTHVRIHNFDSKVPCKALKIKVLSDNGNMNLALREIQVITEKNTEVSKYIQILKNRGCNKILTLPLVTNEKLSTSYRKDGS